MTIVRPTFTDRYASELELFTKAGWEIEFKTVPETGESFLRGKHPDLVLQFSSAIETKSLELPGYVSSWIQSAWQKLNAEVANKWPFPEMRVYPLPGNRYAHYEPKSWSDLRGMMGWLSVDPEKIQQRAFRREHHIVLASPVRDIFGAQVFELDEVDTKYYGRRLMIFDDSNQEWYLIAIVGTSEGSRVMWSAASTGHRVDSIYNADGPFVALGNL